MRLASINLNKRLGNPDVRVRLTTWLRSRKVDVLLVQESWRPQKRAPVMLGGYQPLGGDETLFAWAAENWEVPVIRRVAAFAQRLELGYLVVLNAYLDAYARQKRAAQLTWLRKFVEAEDGHPLLLTGDFNLAPRLRDGQYDGRDSTFNSETDRAPLRDLLASGGLVDTTADTASLEYSITRTVQGRSSQFRCDLALLSDYLYPSVTVAYDHTSRAGDTAFTDHSAILADLPVTLSANTSRQTLFDHNLATAEDLGLRIDCQPHKAAMSRSRPSPFARAVVDVLTPKLEITSVLDHGCGRGTDVRFYRQSGLAADGFDPHPGFGRHQPPERHYDLVTSVFVLNVLSDPWERIQALRHAAGFLRPGGHMLVVTRSPDDIDRRARIAGWRRHNDGYWSSKAKGTVQRGMSSQEITLLARRADLQPALEEDMLAPIPAACQALLVKPG